MRDGIPERQFEAALDRQFSKRKGRTGDTVLEWLCTPPSRHGPVTLREVTQKVAFLKSLGVQEWALNAIPFARIQAYGRAVMHGPPAATSRVACGQRNLGPLLLPVRHAADLAADLAGRAVASWYDTPPARYPPAAQ